MTAIASSHPDQMRRRLQNRPGLGIALMLLGLALYPISDALIKHLTEVYSIPQVSFLRSATRLIPLLIATFFQGGPLRVLATARPGQHMLRLFVNFIFTTSFMLSFKMSSLTVVYTLSYTAPLFTVLLSAYMLKERISTPKWLAVALGMVGVIIATRPGTFEWVSVLVLGATFLSALNKILLRRLAATEHSLAITIYPNIVTILIMFPILIGTWKEMSYTHWGLFTIVGTLAALAQYTIAQAFRFTQASTLAPLDYSSFLWTLSLDFLWWNKTPDVYTFLGAIVIASSNFYIIYRGKREETAQSPA